MNRNCKIKKIKNNASAASVANLLFILRRQLNITIKQHVSAIRFECHRGPLTGQIIAKNRLTHKRLHTPKAHTAV